MVALNAKRCHALASDAPRKSDDSNQRHHDDKNNYERKLGNQNKSVTSPSELLQIFPL